MAAPPGPDVLLQLVASASLSHPHADVFAEWLKTAAVPPAWRGARVHGVPAAAAPALVTVVHKEAEQSSEELVEELVVVEELALEDCAVGDWVEVESGKPQKWFGQIEKLRPGSTEPLAVRWLAPSQAKAGSASTLHGTWLFRGGSHFIELAAVRQLNRNMFHPALRPGLPPPEARGSKPVFCHARACTCSAAAGGVTGGSTAAQQQPLGAPRKTGHNSEPAQQPQLMPLVTWEPGVTADVAPDLFRAAPFVYVCDRLYNLSGQPGGFEIEERVPGRCHCKGRAHSIHCANGECASQVINSCIRGGVPRRLCVKSSGNGRGHGVFAAEDIQHAQFVCEYVGEVIRRDDAKRREKNYAGLGLFYLHDVHGAKELGGENSFTIDPTHYGNLSRCLNHCCTPNLTTCEIPVARAPRSAADGPGLPRVPRVGFFALRDISAGEELTIDYSPGRTGDELKKVLRCRCSAGEQCKGWLF